MAAVKWWYPKTCSEDQGCILELTNPTTLAGIGKTCTGHANDFGRSIGIPSFTGLAHNAIITGDQTVHNAIITDNIAGTEKTPGTPFKIKDEMRIGDVSGLGMGPILVIYESSLHSSSVTGEAPPDVSFLNSSFSSIAAANPGVTKVCLDQESWWTSGVIDSAHISYYLTLIEVAHNYWPDVGLYSGVPERYTLYMTGTASQNATRFTNWVARQQANAQIFDAVNTLYPSLYYINPVYNNATKRDTWYQDNIDICTQLAPGKPVVPFMWPRIHNSVDANMPYIDGTYWRASIDKLRTYGAEGFVIWLFSADVDPRTVSPIPGWWTETLDFISDNGITA